MTEPAGQQSYREHRGNIDCPGVCLQSCIMPRKVDKPRKNRPPRIRVPHQQKAIFTVDNQRFVGIVHRLSLTGGSALLVKGPIPEGTLGEMALGTVFGKVTAHIEFLHTGADACTQGTGKERRPELKQATGQRFPLPSAVCRSRLTRSPLIRTVPASINCCPVQS